MTVFAGTDLILRKRNMLMGSLLFFMFNMGLAAQETSLEQLPELRERALIMHVVSRIVEQNQQVVWNSENTSITMPGRPVGLKLVGSELVVAVQFIPFLSPNGPHTLVAQGQIWVNVPGEGMSFQATMQTIPLEFGQLVYFFPLGPVRSQDEAHIEIQLILEPYTGSGETRVRQGRPEGSPSTGRSGARSSPR
jgi:hypothetical protein